MRTQPIPKPAFVNSFGCFQIEEPVTLLKRYLDDRCIKSVPVLAGLGNPTPVALNCTAPSFVRKYYSMKCVAKFIASNYLPFEVEDNSELTAGFKIKFI